MKKSFTKHIILTFALALFASFNMQAQKAVAFPHQPMVGPEMVITQDDDEGTVKPPCEGVYPANTVWGMNGEGEFADSISAHGWEAAMGGISSPTDIWTWDSDAVAEGQFGGANKALLSTTACNGAALFDFQAYTFIDSDPPVVGITQQGTLTSPVMDLSAANNPVLHFTTRNVRLNDPFTTIAWSANGGVTWTPEMEIPTQNAVNVFTDAEADENIVLPAQELANSANARVRITATGDFYYLLVDDFYVTDEEINDISANSFFAIGSSFTMPESQTDIMPFLIDVENIGNTDMENVSVNVTVVDLGTGTTVHTDDLAFGTVPMGFLDENKAFPTVWTIPPGVQTTYETTYTVTADGESNPSNNTRTFQTVISDSTFAKNTPDLAQSNYWFGEANPYYSSGAHYYIPNGEGHELVNFEWGMSPQADGPFTGFINFRIYEWDDMNNDGEAEESERTLVALADQAVDDSADWYDIVVTPTPLDGSANLPLKDDTHYLFMAHYNPINAMQPGFLVRSTDNGRPQFDPAAMQLALDTLANEGLVPDEMRRYGSLGATGSEGSEDDVNSRVFANLGFQAYVPMRIRPIASDVNEINNDLEVSVFPNPTTEKLFVDVNLEATSDIKIDITDLQGKVLSIKNVESVKTDRIELNVSSLPAGVYNVVITTDEGYTTKQVIVD